MKIVIPTARYRIQGWYGFKPKSWVSDMQFAFLLCGANPVT